MIDAGEFPIDCTGDACAGDTILFAEAVFGGSFRKPKYLGERRVAAIIVADSYGAAKQQHTFTLEVIDSDGVEPLAAGVKTTRKGRNVYRMWTRRKKWPDESIRQSVLDEKHRRGDIARAERGLRKGTGT